MRVLLSVLGMVLCFDALACDGLAVEHAWLRQPPPGSDVAAAYFEARNNGRQTLTIQAVSSPDFKGAMLHATRVVDGRAEMRPQGDIELAPGASFSAAPGGAHVMLFNPRQVITEDSNLTLELRCAQGKPLTVALPVRRDAPR
jgi:hypothetical protein